MFERLLGLWNSWLRIFLSAVIVIDNNPHQKGAGKETTRT